MDKLLRLGPQKRDKSVHFNRLIGVTTTTNTTTTITTTTVNAATIICYDTTTPSLSYYPPYQGSYGGGRGGRGGSTPLLVFDLASLMLSTPDPPDSGTTTSIT